MCKNVCNVVIHPARREQPPTTLASGQVLGLPDHGCCCKRWCWSGEHLFRVAMRWRYYGGDGLVPASCWRSQQHNGVWYAPRCWEAIGGKGQRRLWICWVFQNPLVLKTVWWWYLGNFPTMYSNVSSYHTNHLYLLSDTAGQSYKVKTVSYDYEV